MGLAAWFDWVCWWWPWCALNCQKLGFFHAFQADVEAMFMNA
jgi:hypothetical protein